MRKVLFVLGLALCLGFLGCAKTEKSTIFSWGYWKRHIHKMSDDMHQFRVDIDRTIFDLDDRPIEEQ